MPTIKYQRLLYDVVAVNINDNTVAKVITSGHQYDTAAQLVAAHVSSLSQRELDGYMYVEVLTGAYREGDKWRK